MTTEEYFKQRAILNEKRIKNKNDRFLKRLEKIYKSINKEMVRRIKEFKDKYDLEDNELNSIIINQPLTKEEYAEYLQDVDAILTNSSDYISAPKREELRKKHSNLKLNRVESIKEQTDLILNVFAELKAKGVDNLLKTNIKDSISDIQDTISSVSEIKVVFDKINPKVVEQIAESNWSGKDFSSRIHENTDKTAKEVQKTIENGLAIGESTEQMASELSKNLETDMSKTKRIVRTESNHVLNEATAVGYEEAYVDYYQFLATLDMRTSTLCQDQDMKIYKVSERVVGKNFPPLHPNCRSTTIPYFPEYADEDAGTRIARNAAGENYYVDGNMNYKEWYNSLPDEEKKKMDEALRKERAKVRKKTKSKKESSKDENNTQTDSINTNSYNAEAINATPKEFNNDSLTSEDIENKLKKMSYNSNQDLKLNRYSNKTKENKSDKSVEKSKEEVYNLNRKIDNFNELSEEEKLSLDWAEVDFPNKRSLVSHHRKHVKELGEYPEDTTVDDYLKMTRNLLSKRVDNERVFGFVRESDGALIKYDIGTNEIAIARDGNLITFFKPTEEVDYFIQQILKED